ncbi:hypothetical protein DUI87_18842 [Hirundo rustica rustica]|uniref:Reverse transcriptase domain-containing protein n=1 Tax=Hirundo rustica rustica TaxID=333673 RepID=A0A3M0JV47_HIRRU|nr:hypothetical protein DUI87_18842 [Hirundo rustica rustica]
MSHTLLNTVGQQIEAREQKNKSVIQAAAKPDSEAKTPAVAAVKKGKKHTDKTDRPVDDDSGLLRVKEQQVPIATSIVHRRQYRTTRDAVIPLHKIIRKLKTQGVVSKTHSPFNSPIWPVRKSDGEWRLTVDYRALNKVTPPLSAAVPNMLELQYELESKAAK